jgi:hypothetical protein
LLIPPRLTANCNSKAHFTGAPLPCHHAQARDPEIGAEFAGRADPVRRGKEGLTFNGKLAEAA